MAHVFESLDNSLVQWLTEQKVFFVATAPLMGDGLINCSPKGGDTFRILGPRQVAYQDLTGSGVETIAHLRENGRVVVMFCAFTGPPRIVRLHGVGRAIEPGDGEFEQLTPLFPPHVGTRAFISIALSRISDSCGYAVPRYEYLGPRDVLDKWCHQKGPVSLADYRRKNNVRSLDGLPGLADID